MHDARSPASTVTRQATRAGAAMRCTLANGATISDERRDARPQGGAGSGARGAVDVAAVRLYDTLYTASHTAAVGRG